jgi:hypothetical protein
VAGLAVVRGVQEFVAEDIERQHGIAHRRIDKHLIHALGRAAPGPARADAEVRAAAAGKTAPELHVGRDDDAELRPLFGDFSGGLDEPCLALGNHNFVLSMNKGTVVQRATFIPHLVLQKVPECRSSGLVATPVTVSFLTAGVVLPTKLLLVPRLRFASRAKRFTGPANYP